MVQPLWKLVWRILKLKINHPQDPAISLLGICPKTWHPTPLILAQPCFIAALFTIARKWKQPEGPSTDEWIM